jgi:hypothetical protein
MRTPLAHRRPLAAVVLLGAVFGSAHARQDDYSQQVVEASNQRFIEQPPEVFESLRVIGAADLQTIVVEDGSGGTRSVEVVRLSTLTSFLTPYENAEPFDPFTVDSQGYWRSNIWTCVAGDIAAYHFRNGLPLDDEAAITSGVLQSLGMQVGSGFMVLTFYVEPRFVTRPSFAPAIDQAVMPTWNGKSYEVTYSPGAPAGEFKGFAPTVLENGQWQRPFTMFDGPREFPSFLDAWSTMSYELDADRAFPYTGLGWTWNWSDDAGLQGFAISEFLVSGDATFWFDDLVSPRQALENAAVAFGDLNLDGVVSGRDLTILLSLWGEVDPSRGDLDHDGTIDQDDVSIMLQRWGALADQF